MYYDSKKTWEGNESSQYISRLFVFEFTVREFLDLKFGSIMLIKNLICLSSCLLVIMADLEYKIEKIKKWKIEINDI